MQCRARTLADHQCGRREKKMFCQREIAKGQTEPTASDHKVASGIFTTKKIRKPAMAYAQASLIEKTLEPMDARKQKETLVESRPLATPESRFECARTAITEALGLCATADGKPNMAALAAAEDRYNTALAEDMMAAVVAYVGRVDDTDNTDSTDDNSDSGVEGEMRMSIGPEFFEIFEASCQTWREGRTRLGTHEDAVAAFVSRARNPCATLGPFSQCGYHCPRVLADPIYTGRPQNVETAMWRTWWATCIEMLTSTAGPNGPPGSVHPLE